MVQVFNVDSSNFFNLVGESLSTVHRVVGDEEDILPGVDHVLQEFECVFHRVIALPLEGVRGER